MFQFHSFTCSYSVFLTPLVEGTAFSHLYTLASFVIDYLIISVSLFWPFYPVPLINAFVFVQVPYCFVYCTLLYSLKSGNMISLALFFFLKLILPCQGLLCFHTSFKIICSSSVKTTSDTLTEIALNLKIELNSMFI